jgi:hypothetical protein
VILVQRHSQAGSPQRGSSTGLFQQLFSTITVREVPASQQQLEQISPLALKPASTFLQGFRRIGFHQDLFDDDLHW